MTNPQNPPASQSLLISETTGAVAGGLVINSADVKVGDPKINNDGLFNDSPGGIISGLYRPGNQQLSPAASNLQDLITQPTAQPQLLLNGVTPQVNASAADASAGMGLYINTDPLVLDLSGGGLSLSNWVSNNIYFQTNVVKNATGALVSDGQEHHTSWVNAGDGILVFQPNAATPITDITQTFSEFFNGKSYANGFAALQSLVKTDPTTGKPYTIFSAATAATDPNTGVSYWNETKVWQDANQDGIAQTSELFTLDQLGIASINLAGSANTGQQVNGNNVTSTSSYTTTSGATNEIASVELQTNTTGDVTTSATGGYVVTSTPEGGASSPNSFVVDPAATAGHVYDRRRQAVSVASTQQRRKTRDRTKKARRRYALGELSGIAKSTAIRDRRSHLCGGIGDR